MSVPATDRVDQRHVLRRGQPRVARREGDVEGQVPAGALPGHGDAARVGAEAARVRHRPAVRGERVFVRRRESVLGRLAVMHQQHNRAGFRLQGAGRGVVSVEVGDHPAAAVPIHDEGRAGGAARRPVDAGGDRPRRSRNRDVAHLRHGPRRGGLAALLEHAARRVRRSRLAPRPLDGKRFDRLRAERAQRGDHLRHVRVGPLRRRGRAGRRAGDACFPACDRSGACQIRELLARAQRQG